MRSDAVRRYGRRSLSATTFAGVLLLAACEKEPTYQSAGERLDAAIERVEELKAELREAELELQAARRALGQKVEQAPGEVSEVPAAAGDDGS